MTTRQVAGLIAIFIFYVVMFLLGIWASWRKCEDGSRESLLLAGRSMPLLVGIFTMTATWVGGGYINGTAEAIYESGLVWTQAPWCYALSLILGGLLFVTPMRRHGFTTMLDPFESRYGERVAAGLFLPALLGDVLWSAAILTALGSTFQTVLQFEHMETAILISAGVAIAYTVAGGLWSVAYTDVLQLLCILVGLVIVVPFAMQHTDGLMATLSTYREHFGEAVKPWPPPSFFEGGEPQGWVWLDTTLMLVLGGIPWQVYFQRVLACKSSRDARMLSVLGGFGCIVMAIPAVLIGVIALSADWSNAAVDGPTSPVLVLPDVLFYLTPFAVAVVGLGAVSAAVMSSVDSSILSTSSMFAWNIYRPLAHPNADDRRLRIVIRCAILGVGALATLIASVVQQVYALWFLCSDVVYVVMFPELVAVLFFKRANAIGAVSGAIVGFLLRLGGGVPDVGIPQFLPYPGGDLFPYRTFAMVSALATIIVVSLLTARWSKPRAIGT